MPDPYQNDIEASDSQSDFDYRGISRVAWFEARVLVLARKEYPQRDSDPLSRVSPIDLGVAWGEAGKASLREHIKFYQPFRRLAWRYNDRESAHKAQEVLPVIMTSVGNWHMIPASPSVARELDKVKVGKVVSLKGYLVNVKADEGFVMETSTVRTDTGDGACEIFMVEEISYP